jgi:hypothetical protein
MTETKYIIALCPVTPRYLHRDTADAYRSEGKYATADKSAARVFDTFDAAMQVANKIKGWNGAQRVEQVAVEVAPTMIVAARNPHDTEARDWQPTSARIVCNNTLTPRKPSVNAFAEALRGLSTEQKIVAMANALIEAGVTLHRDTDPGDGSPAIGATMPDGSTCTVLTIERPVPFITDAEIRRLDMIVAASLKRAYSGWNIIDISNSAYCDLETVGHIEIPARYTVTNRPVVIDRKNLS